MGGFWNPISVFLRQLCLFVEVIFGLDCVEVRFDILMDPSLLFECSSTMRLSPMDTSLDCRGFESSSVLRLSFLDFSEMTGWKKGWPVLSSNL